MFKKIAKKLFGELSEAEITLIGVIFIIISVSMTVINVSLALGKQ